MLQPTGLTLCMTFLNICQPLSMEVGVEGEEGWAGNPPCLGKEEEDDLPGRRPLSVRSLRSVNSLGALIKRTCILNTVCWEIS